jgi:galactokinase
MRDDFDASRMELDIAVEAALESGALGARMTGYGGSVIALIDKSRLGPLAERINGRFGHHEFAAPTLTPVAPASGAREVTP